MPKYIDAEPYEGMLVVKPIVAEIDLGKYCKPSHFCQQDFAVKTAIDDIPKADVQEVKHGKWIQDHGWYSHHCTECGRSTSDYVAEDGDLYDRVFNFCPNCGARMDGDETNAEN